ncbi:MAG: hypothetical protein ACPG77_12245 [Nannocystaceae bacterium]
MRRSDWVFGVDEAGRGPLLGPMAMAVVGVDRAATDVLTELGVQDSKRFGSGAKARKMRGELAAKILECTNVSRCTLVPVGIIDTYTFQGQLNGLERQVARDLLQAARAPKQAEIICDGARMFAPMTELYPNLRAVNDGESEHVAVAAASILAKHARDQAFEAIMAGYRAEFGEIGGGGYINAATRKFMSAYEQRYGDVPPQTRRSWGAEKKRKPNKTTSKPSTQLGLL